MEQNKNVCNELAGQIRAPQEIVEKVLHDRPGNIVQRPIAETRQDVDLQCRLIGQPRFRLQPAFRSAHPIVAELSELDVFRLHVPVIANRLQNHAEGVLGVILGSKSALPLLFSVGRSKHNRPAVASVNDRTAPPAARLFVSIADGNEKGYIDRNFPRPNRNPTLT